MEYKEDEYLMLYGIQHFAFCLRQWALIHIEQHWAENYQTTSGMLMHGRAHEDGLYELRGDLLTVHNLRVSSRKLGVTGQCDIVEFHRVINGITLHNYEGQWDITPIEYKRGTLKEENEDEKQLCLQAICLEEKFQTVIPFGYLFYGENRRRFKVEFTEELRNDVMKAVKEMHRLLDRGYTPKVKKTKKCRSCSLKDICIPNLNTNKNVGKYIDQHIMET